MKLSRLQEIINEVMRVRGDIDVKFDDLGWEGSANLLDPEEFDFMVVDDDDDGEWVFVISV